MADPTLRLIREAGKIPEYQEMVDYLATRRAVPPVDGRYDSDRSLGVYVTNSWSNQGPGTVKPQGEIQMNWNAPVSALVHEMTHAASRQMSIQAAEGKRSFGRPVDPTQFEDAYQKLGSVNAVTSMISKLSPEFAKAQSGYRATSREATAFGMESATSPGSLSFIEKAPSHIDSTLATEFMILLDLAARESKKKQGPAGR